MNLIGRNPRQGTIRRSRKVRDVAPFRPPWRIVGALIAACFLFAAASTQAQCLRVTDRFDAGFEQAVHRHWPATFPTGDWRLLKAQCLAESSLNPFAVSPVGATGLCQFMPATWAEVTRRIDLRGAQRRYWRDSIEAAAYYMADRGRFWTEPRPEAERWRLAGACYNAGCGTVYRVQVQHGGLTFADFAPHLPEETREYVPRIEGYFGRLHACGGRR